MIRLFKTIRKTLLRKGKTTDYPFNNIVEILFLKAGIPDEIKDKIFQSFFTTKPTGQGTGLGLSLAYDIVKAHGGDLRVELNQNEGTNFTITLPKSN